MSLIVAPPELMKAHAQIVAQLRRQKFRFDEVTPQQIEYARYTATCWTVSLVREPSRYTLTLPEDPRKLGILPSAAQNAVIFALGEILEIWHAERWITHVQAIVKNMDSVRAAVLDQLLADGDP